MNRQKKELIKQIRALEEWIAVDEELGCGFAPPNAYHKECEEIYRLQEKLAQLRHYGSAEEMLYDERGQTSVENILRQEERKQNKNSRTGSKKPRRHSRETGR